jgi:microcystin-dependent protein
MEYPFLGQIELFSFPHLPKGWRFCEGQLITITKNQALYSLIGTTYGGDGVHTYALPNLKGKEPMPNMHYCIAWEGIYPSAQGIDPSAE